MTRRHALGNLCLLVGIPLLTTSVALAQANAPLPEPTGWIAGGFVLSLVGMVLNFGQHIEFKGEAKRRLNELETSAAKCPDRQELGESIERVVEEMNRRFTEVREDFSGLRRDTLRLIDRRARRDEVEDDGG